MSGQSWWGSSLRRPCCALASVGGSRDLRPPAPPGKRDSPSTFHPPPGLAYTARHEPRDAPSHLLCIADLAVALCLAAALGPAALDPGEPALPADRRLPAQRQCLHHARRRRPGARRTRRRASSRGPALPWPRPRASARPVLASSVHNSRTGHARPTPLPHPSPTRLKDAPPPHHTRITPLPPLPTGPAAARAGPCLCVTPSLPRPARARLSP